MRFGYLRWPIEQCAVTATPTLPPGGEGRRQTNCRWAGWYRVLFHGLCRSSVFQDPIFSCQVLPNCCLSFFRVVSFPRHQSKNKRGDRQKKHHLPAMGNKKAWFHTPLALPRMPPSRLTPQPPPSRHHCGESRGAVMIAAGLPSPVLPRPLLLEADSGMNGAGAPPGALCCKIATPPDSAALPGPGWPLGACGRCCAAGCKALALFVSPRSRVFSLGRCHEIESKTVCGVFVSIADSSAI